MVDISRTSSGIAAMAIQPRSANLAATIIASATTVINAPAALIARRPLWRSLCFRQWTIIPAWLMVKVRNAPIASPMAGTPANQPILRCIPS